MVSVDVKYHVYFALASLLPAESDFPPTTASREQRSYQKSDPGGDHYYIGCLGETRVSLAHQ